MEYDVYISQKSNIKIAFTGHRHLRMKDVELQLKNIFTQYPDAMWITGGAFGFDSAAAQFAMDYKIPLWLCLPFPSEILSARWPRNSPDCQTLINSIKFCTELSILRPVFSMTAYQLRNEFMVDNCDILAPFFDGSPGGTKNCIKYAQKVGCKIMETMMK